MECITNESNLSFEINTADLTAKVIHSPHAKGDVFIPSTVKYEMQEYKIIGIKEDSFKKNKNIQSINASNNSYLQSIGNSAFSNSLIKSLSIPSKVEKLDDFWCKNVYILKAVTISPLNKHFAYLDDKHQIIVGKSDNNSEIFDTIIFASRNIKHATIPKYIKYIKPYSFANCKKLKSIEISEDSELLSIGKKALSYTSIGSFFIPANVEELENSWFHGNVILKTLKISESNKNFKFLDESHQIVVGKSDKNEEIFDVIIFANRDIKSVTIPKYIKQIKPYAFEYCKRLKSIEISKDSELLSIGKKAFSYTLIESLFIPSKFVELEDNWCFSTSKLEKVTISASNKHFKYLDESHQIIFGKSDKNKEIFDTIIFASRDIKYATIPKYIKYIKTNSFQYCKTLEALNFEKNSELLSIGKGAFSGTSIKSLTIPKSVIEIQKYAFYSCYALQKVSFEKGSKLKSLEDGTFSWSLKLESIEIPENSELVSIGAEVFSSTSIENFNIPPKLSQIDDRWCFVSSNLKNVTISASNKNFKYLDDEHQIIVGKSDKNTEIFDTIIFANRCIKHATIPQYIKYIKPHSFEKCKKLETLEIPENSQITSFPDNFISSSLVKSIFIPSNVEVLGDCWLYGSSGLQSITFSPLNKNFNYLDDEHQIVVGKSDKNKEIFDAIIFASRSIKHVTIPKYIKCIKPFAFENCKQLETVEIENDSELEIIDRFAFSFASSLKEIRIPKNVRKIERCVFFCCESLQKVFFEEGSKVRSFANSLFYSCKRLKKIDITDNSSLKLIEKDVFSFSGIEDLYVPKSVEELKDGLFDYSLKIKTMSISPSNENFKYLDDEHQIVVGKSDTNQEIFDVIIFANRNIKHVTIPKYIKCIYSNAFEYCKKLETIDIPDDSQIETIGSHAFSETSLLNFKVPQKVCKYDFLSENQKLLCLEFLGDSVIDDKEISIFDEFENLFLVSFPNIHKYKVSSTRYCGFLSKEFKLFINACADVSVIYSERRKTSDNVCNISDKDEEEEELNEYPFA